MAAGLDDRPEEKDLLHVARAVSSNWKFVLIDLGLTNNKIQTFWQSSLAQPEEACFSGLVVWRHGNGVKPVSWRTLFGCLRNLALGEEIRDLSKKFNLVVEEPDLLSESNPGPLPPCDARKEKDFTLRNLMPYVTDLSGVGLDLAVLIDRTGEWDGLQQSPGQPKDHVIRLLKAWLEDSPTEQVPHTWGFLIETVRSTGKGALADKIARERFQ